MDKILASYVTDFANKHGFDSLDVPEQFLHFVNYCVASRHTSDTLDIENLSTEGDGDTGVDGVAVLVNGHTVSSPEDVDFFRHRGGRFDVEFVFVQSKSSEKFSAADIGTFLFGVKEFFADAPRAKANSAIAAFRQIKDYVYSLSIEMNAPPECSLYYASAGEWHDDPNLTARAEAGLAELRATNLFSEPKFTALDATRLKAVYRTLRNRVECEILFDKHTILPQIAGVTEAYLGILPCQEYLKLIADEEGEIRRGLFYDNVRDYQGDNPVNREIAATIEGSHDDGQFVLLNNGVTIVARSINKVGAKFRITDYQIVNGCQTSHVLHQTRGRLSGSVCLPIKLVVTDNSEITNRVIRATNRQTEVKAEAFESLSPFHRTLEEFYSAVGKDSKDRLYYERRSKQYASLPVDDKAIVSLAMQCHSFLGMFLDEPHSTHRYYGEILAATRGRMFQEDHRPYPYYASALCLARVDELFRRRALDRRYRKFRHHIMMLIRVTAAGKSMPPVNSRNMDRYCASLVAVLLDDRQFTEHARAAVASIDAAMSTFAGDRVLANRLRSFTMHLVPGLSRRPTGQVTHFDLDRGFGFIQSPACDRSVFVHCSSIRGTLHRYLRIGETVEFDLVNTDRGFQAEDVRVVAVKRDSKESA